MAGQDQAPLIEVRAVTKRFKGQGTVLDGIDLTVERGQRLLVRGPSGSGKSTLLHLLAALDRPTSGSIVVAGRDLSHRHGLDTFRRSTIGMVFQLHNLLPHLTAAQNVEIVMLGTGLHRDERAARTSELLGELGLGGKAGVRPPELSGGERQRVAIARAVANRPTVILADEPTASLDAIATELVLEMLGRAVDETDGCLIAVSHDASVDRMATRTLELADGQLREVEAVMA